MLKGALTEERGRNETKRIYIYISGANAGTVREDKILLREDRDKGRLDPQR